MPRLPYPLMLTALFGVSCLGASAPAVAVMLTGEVRATDAQPIYVPQSNSSPLVLRYFVAEGERVEKGDVVLRIDPGNALSILREQEATIEQSRADMAKDLARLRVEVVDAELALADAEAALANATIDAAIPVELISALDFDRYQGELERSKRETELKRNELAVARAAVSRRQEDGKLKRRAQQAKREYYAARIETAEVRAKRDGVVVHDFNHERLGGGRIDEGSTTFTGTRAGAVVSGGEMQVQAWALEPDRRGLKAGQIVGLTFDALPGSNTQGRIRAISGAPTAKPEWGEGRYFRVDIDLLEPGGLRLLPGMSVRVDAQLPPTRTAKPASAS